MTQRQPTPNDEAIGHVASLFAQALSELQRQAAANGDTAELKTELAMTRAAVQELTQRVERDLLEDKEQRFLLAGQLTSLASSLDRLVTHLEGLSGLMTTLIERIAAPSAPAQTPAAPPPAEPAFAAGGEGVSLALLAVPGFQALMDIQKALIALEEVAGASVERFQEGDSRMLVHLKAPLKASDLTGALHRATGQNFVVEESRPELARLRIKLIPGA
jgi:hypothetical protein